MRNTVIGLILLAGCGSTIPEPDNAVVGIWGGRMVELRVSSTQSVLQHVCLAVRLPPIVLDDQGQFDVVGIISEASWGGSVGLDFRVYGTVEDSVMAMYGQTRFDAGWSEPILDSLFKGSEGDFSPPTGWCIV